MKKETKKPVPLVTPEIFAELIKAIVDTAERDRRQAQALIKAAR